MTRLFYVSAVLLLLGIGTASAQSPADGKGSLLVSPLGKSLNGISGLKLSCDDGFAAGFPCRDVDLQAFVPIADLSGPNDPIKMHLSDLWGWTDPQTHHEYALVGLTFGTAFVDVTDPVEPHFSGFMPMPQTAHSSVWRDIKVFQDYAFVVSDGASRHGMQVFDLERLRGASDEVFTPDALYTEFASAHNIVMNEESGFAYVVGANGPGQTCGGGLHMIDVHDPLHPAFAGCFSDPRTGIRGTGYTHDAECVDYHGPDADYQGREICFGLNETGVSIADVTDKSNPVAISVGRYPDYGYVHQGWLTADQRYLLVDDEGDERQYSRNTETKIFDVADLDVPVVAGTFENSTHSIDHNLYVKGNLAYESNYTSGLRILDIRDPLNPEEIAYFDTTPSDSAVAYAGTWSVYPYFDSGNVIVSSIGEGLFVLRPRVENFEVPEETAVSSVFPNPFNASTTFNIALVDPEVTSIKVFDALGRLVTVLHDGVLAGGRVHRFTFDASGLPSGAYIIRVQGQTFESTRTVTLTK
ncbi:MAG: choice-of-anchor B family protein [Rhodothermales bacterium]